MERVCRGRMSTAEKAEVWSRPHGRTPKGSSSGESLRL